MELWKYNNVEADGKTVLKKHEYKTPFVWSVESPSNDYTLINGYDEIAGVVEKLPHLKSKLEEHKINCLNNKEIDISLDSSPVYGTEPSNRGLLLAKEYRYGEDLFFKVSYEYKFNRIGEPSRQRKVLCWYNEDGSENELKKDKGFKKLSVKQRRDSVHKRRESIILLLEIEVMKLLTAGATTDAEAQGSISVGANLMAEITPEIEKYKSSGKTNPLVNKLNALSTTFTFLNNEIAQGITVINYIINFLSY